MSNEIYIRAEREIERKRCNMEWVKKVVTLHEERKNSDNSSNWEKVLQEERSEREK